MCGIIGYIGYRSCQDILFEGLRRLEYRGYDSAGVAWLEDGRATCVRAVGNLESLGEALGALGEDTSQTGPAVTTGIVSPSVGIGHTRWATHGAVTERNAHPHVDASGRIRIVLNGIIENHVELRDRLARDDIRCSSETDAEVVAQLIAVNYDDDLASAVRKTVPMLSGHYAFVAMSQDEPDILVGTRHECPLVIGIGEEEHFVASAPSAFNGEARALEELRDGEIAVLRPDELVVLDRDGRRRPLSNSHVPEDEDRCGKGGFETFMLKEIWEQPHAAADTLLHSRVHSASGADDLLSDRFLRTINRVLIIGCGTSYHAGLLGRAAIERWARIPVDVEIASEFRYRDPIIHDHTLALCITQSGETADTLAAMRLARERGATVAALTNVAGSQATRESDAVLFTRAGLEVGVAATKTFVAQVVVLYAFALRLARLSGRGLQSDTLADLHSTFELLPGQIGIVLDSVSDRVQALAERLAASPFFLYLGRLSGLPVAMEGALKLKEIAYVPTDAYPAGEMKHGPIALLSDQTPVVCVATESGVFPKLMSNVSEVRTRGAPVVAVAAGRCAELDEHAEEVFYLPPTDSLFQAVLAVLPLQLFAYHVARMRGLNVDQPRNLAKTVTVE